MIHSTVRISASTIKLAEEYISGPKIEIGFFVMYLGSKLQLSDGTVVQNLRAKKYGAIHANSMSSIDISNTLFKDNISTSRNSALIVLQNCNSSTILNS